MTAHLPRRSRIRRAVRSWLPVLAAATALTLASTRTSAQAPPDDAAALRTYFSANGLLNRGLYDLAITEYRAFLTDHADHEKADIARYGLGVSLFRLSRHREALAEIEPLAFADSFDYAAEVETIRGQCHLALREYEQAALRFQEVLDKHIDHPLADDAAALQAEAWHLAGVPARVERPCRFLAARWPDSPLRERADLFWGLAEMAQGSYTEAASRFEELRRRFPEGSHADQTALLHAQSLHRSNAPQRALEQYRNVLKQAHDTYVPEALYGLSLLLYQQDQPGAAGPVLDEMLDRFSEHDLAPAAHLLRGRVWFDRGDLDEARDQFDRVSGRGEYADDAAYWSAKCELRGDRPASGAERLARAIEQFPRSELLPEMMYDHAVALARAERPAEAIDQLDEFRKRFPNHALAAEALHLMASTEHQRERYEESLSLCRLFRSRHPDHPLIATVDFLAAENAFLAQDYRESERAYGSFLDTHPEDPQRAGATYRLGMSLYQLGRNAEAEPLLAQSAARRKQDATFVPASLALGDLHFQAGRWSDAETHLSDYLAYGLDQPSADDALFKLGLTHHRQDELDEALRAYDRLLEAFPESHQPQVVFERGQALMMLDRADEAAGAFRHVLKRAPDSRFAVHALNHLGSLALSAQEYEKAARIFDEVASREGADPEIVATALAQQGASHFAAGAFEDAADSFRTLLDRYPASANAPRSQAQLAIALARQDQHSSALEQIGALEERGVETLDPELRSTLGYEKAWCLRALDRPDEAAVAYADLLRDPDASDLAAHAMLELAELESNAGRHDAAAAHLRRILDGEGAPAPVREQAMYRLGVTAYEQGRHDEAARRLAKFIEKHPTSELVASAHLLAGESYFKSGAHQRAVVHLEHIINGDRDTTSYAPALLRTGECYGALQDWAKSEKAFTDYLRCCGKSDLAYQAQFGVGWARENQGQRASAIDAYRKVVDRHQGPTAARAQFQIGECLFAEKKYEEAARELLKVDILYAYPEWSAAALYEAARCFRERGDPAQARALFEQVQRDHAGLRWGALAADRLAEISRSGLPGRDPS